MEDFISSGGQTYDVAEAIKKFLQQMSEVETFNHKRTTIKELLQNSDDAKATKVRIILDERNIDLNAREASYNILVSPALIIINNAKFRKKNDENENPDADDFEALCKVAQRHKICERSSAGRFGMGFNSVYYLTDTPIIFSRRKIHLFDLLHKINVAEGNNNGAIFDLNRFPKDNADRLGDIKTLLIQCFPKKSLVCDTHGYNYSLNEIADNGTDYLSTVIRLPLRTENTGVFMHEDFYSSENKRIDLLGEIADECRKSILFLKYITDINISILRTNKEEEDFSEIHISDNPKIYNVLMENIEKKENCETKLYKRTISVKNFKNNQTSRYEFLVKHILEYNDNISQMLENLERNSEKAVPWAGIAVPISKDAFNFDGPGNSFWRVFLPVILKSQSKAIIHSCFFVGISRNGIEFNENGSDELIRKTNWNKLLVDELILKLLQNLSADLTEHDDYKEVIENDPKEYIAIFPDYVGKSRVTNISDYLSQKFQQDWTIKLKDIYNESFELFIEENYDITIELIPDNLLQYKERFRSLTTSRRKFVTDDLGNSLIQKLNIQIKDKIIPLQHSKISTDVIMCILRYKDPPIAGNLKLLLEELPKEYFDNISDLEGCWAFETENDEIIRYSLKNHYYYSDVKNKENSYHSLSYLTNQVLKPDNVFFIKQNIGICALDNRRIPDNIRVISEDTVCRILANVKDDIHDKIDDIDFIRSIIDYLDSLHNIPDNINIKFLIKTDKNKKNLRKNGILFIKPPKDELESDKALNEIWNDIIKKIFPEPEYLITDKLYALFRSRTELLTIVSQNDCRVLLYDQKSVTEAFFCDEFSQQGLLDLNARLNELNNKERKADVIESWAIRILKHVTNNDDDFLIKYFHNIVSLPIHRTPEGKYIPLSTENYTPESISDRFVLQSDYDSSDCPVDIEDKITLNPIGDDKKLIHLFYTTKLKILPKGRELFFRETIKKLADSDDSSIPMTKKLIEYIEQNITIIDSNPDIQKLYYERNFIPSYDGYKYNIKEKFLDITDILQRSNIVNNEKSIILALYCNDKILEPDFIKSLRKIRDIRYDKVNIDDFCIRLLECPDFNVSHKDRLLLLDNFYSKINGTIQYDDRNMDYWNRMKICTIDGDGMQNISESKFMDFRDPRINTFFTKDMIGMLFDNLIDMEKTAEYYGCSSETLQVIIDNCMLQQITDNEEFKRTLADIFENIWNNINEVRRFILISYLYLNEQLCMEIIKKYPKTELAKTRAENQWQNLSEVYAPKLHNYVPANMLPREKICEYDENRLPEEHSQNILSFYNKYSRINDITTAMEEILKMINRSTSYEDWQNFYAWIDSALEKKDITPGDLDKIFSQNEWIFSVKDEQYKICRAEETFLEKDLSKVLTSEYWTAVYDIFPKSILKYSDLFKLRSFNEDRIEEGDIAKLINCLEASHDISGNILIQIYSRIAKAIYERDDLIDAWENLIKFRDIFRLYNSEDDTMVSIESLYIGNKGIHKNFGKLIYCLNTDIDNPKQVTKSYGILGVNEKLKLQQIIYALSKVDDEMTYNELIYAIESAESDSIDDIPAQDFENIRMISADNKFRRIQEQYYDENLSEYESIKGNLQGLLIKSSKANKMLMNWLEKNNINIVRHLKRHIISEAPIALSETEDSNAMEIILPWNDFLINIQNPQSLLRDELMKEEFEIVEQKIPAGIKFVDRIAIDAKIEGDLNINFAASSKKLNVYLCDKWLYISTDGIEVSKEIKFTDLLDKKISDEIFRIIKYSYNKPYLKTQIEFTNICLEHLERPSKILKNYNRSFNRDVIVLYYDQFSDKEFHQLYDQYKSLSSRSAMYSDIEKKMHVIIKNNFIEKRREQILGHGYTQFSIITELIQNAEDAYTQMHQLELPIEDNDKTIIFSLQDNNLNVIHNGREFNRWCNMNKNIQIPTFKNDISGILRSSGSFKRISDNHSQQGTTGKFGIGFKCVYLITDEPIIHSGQWHFKIRSAAIPEEIAKPEKYNDKETIFILPFSKGITFPELEEIDDYYKKFVSLLPFLEEIQKVTLKNDNFEYATKLKKIRIAESSNNHAMELINIIKNDDNEKTLIRLKHMDKASKIGFLIDQNGMIQQWSDYFCNDVYCKLPMHDALKCGIGVSHSFDLQSGRTHMILSDISMECFDDIVDLIEAFPLYWKKYFEIFNIKKKDFARQFWNIFDLDKGDVSTEKLRQKIAESLFLIARKYEVIPVRSDNVLVKLEDNDLFIADNLSADFIAELISVPASINWTLIKLIHLSSFFVNKAIKFIPFFHGREISIFLQHPMMIISIDKCSYSIG